MFEKSKMFVYKEDFNKFLEALQETIGHIKTELMPEFDFDQYKNEQTHEQAPVANEETDDYASGGSSDLKWE